MKVLSVNLHLFPHWLKQNELSTIDAVDGIVSHIKALDFDPDLLIFQELWAPKARLLLTRGLKDCWRYALIDNRYGKFLLGVNSGLAVYSKFPIVDFIRQDYKEKKGDEYFSRKGILGVKLEINNKRDYVYVFTTHLQAGDGHIRLYIDKIPVIGKWLSKKLLRVGKDSAEIRKDQLLQAKNVIDAFSKGTPFLFASDFNISNVTSEYSELLGILGVVDTFDTKLSRYPGSVAAECNINRRIDFMLLSSSRVKSKIGYSIITNDLPNLTDHMTICGNFNFQK